MKFFPQHWQDTPYGLAVDAAAGALTDDKQVLFAAYQGSTVACHSAVAQLQMGKAIKVITTNGWTLEGRMPEKATEKAIVRVPMTNRSTVFIFNRQAFKPGGEMSHSYIFCNVEQKPDGTWRLVPDDPELLDALFNHIVEIVHIPVLYEWRQFLFEMGSQYFDGYGPFGRWLDDQGIVPNGLASEMPAVKSVNLISGAALISVRNSAELWHQFIRYGLSTGRINL